jgi:hypothetical protein
LRKYFTEFGLDVYTSYKTLIPVENLEYVKDFARYHVYFILSIPRVMIHKDSFSVETSGVSFSISRVNNDDGKEIKISNLSILPEIDHTKIEYNIEYPYDKLFYQIDKPSLEKFYDNHSSQIDLTKSQFIEFYNNPIDAQNFIYGSLIEQMKSLEMEVLYIGKSYGKDGHRLAQDRLSSHSTLQKILTDFHSKYQDRRIFLLLLEMSPILNTTMDGINKEYEVSDEEDEEHIEKVISNLPIYEQVINITEAAMINYFKPHYNTIFVDNFPSDKHKGYRQYFDLDYNCLTVELDLEFDNMPNIELFTKENKIRSSWDFIEYNLFNDPNRKNMNDIFVSKSKLQITSPNTMFSAVPRVRGLVCGQEYTSSFAKKYRQEVSRKHIPSLTESLA